MKVISINNCRTYVYIYIYIYIVCMCVYIYIYIHICVYIYIYICMSTVAVPIRYCGQRSLYPPDTTSSNSPFKLGSNTSMGRPAGFHSGGGRARARSAPAHNRWLVHHSSPNGRRYCKMTCSTVRTAYHVSQDCTMIRLKSACPCGMLLTPPTSRAMSCQGCRDSLFAPLLISAYNNDHRHFARSNGQFKSEGLILD